MPNLPTPKSAVVTGSSRGIGAAIAERLASDGFGVVINYAGRADAANEVAERISSDGGKAKVVQADVSKRADVVRMFDEATEAFGGVDVLVNNAGVLSLAPIAETDDEAFDRIMAVNVKGAFNGMREAAKRLRDGGRIINLSTSVVGSRLPTYGAYAASKGAVETMTHILSKELGSRRITVNAVAPGPVATELFFDGKSDELVARIKSQIPLGRLGEVGDIAPTVAFLASEEGQWVNGQVLRVNGGMV
ncbi:MAG: 3-ketoacyl-ACP reductase [Phycisphaerae bacterium]|nr:3-ketoacyl-ACP reductase [Phycisphaerae bacterium]